MCILITISITSYWGIYINDINIYIKEEKRDVQKIRILYERDCRKEKEEKGRMKQKAI